MKQDLQYCVDKTLSILNEYTSVNSQYSLKYRLTQEGTKIHTCLVRIAGTYNKSKYRKTPNKKNSIVYIPTSSAKINF